MLEIIRNEQGDIIGVCEWWIVNEKGKMDDHGIYIWIAEIEISPTYRNNGVIKKFIKEITLKVPQAKYGYFWRQRKYPNRKQKTYRRETWLRRTKGE